MRVDKILPALASFYLGSLLAFAVGPIRLARADNVGLTESVVIRVLKNKGLLDSSGSVPAAGGVSSVAGTSNQVNVSAATGAVTFSLPQSIGTGSSPTFNGLTVTTGLGATSGGTGATTVTSGDLLYGSASNVWSKLPKGADGTYLTLVAGLPAWGSVSAGTTVFPIDTAPGSANAMDDEFEAASIDAKWTQFSTTGGGTVKTQSGNGVLNIAATAGGGHEIWMFEQTTSATTFKFRAKCDYFSAGAGASGVGIYVRNSTDGKSTSIMHRDDASAGVNTRGWYVTDVSGASANGSTNITTIMGLAESSGSTPFWVEIEQDASNLYFRASQNGVNFYTIATRGKTSFITSGVNRVGLLCYATTTDVPFGNFHWFRRVS